MMLKVDVGITAIEGVALRDRNPSGDKNTSALIFRSIFGMRHQTKNTIK